MWWQKKDYKYYHNKGFVSAVFAPKEKLEALKKRYEKLKLTNKNLWQLRAEMEGFMQGLEKRNRSRLDILDKTKQPSRETDLER
ncbi:MAG: hypothetical protein GKR88_02195 [Flavobacteriaceae bacterium]|nr:MAG: hypothetical protein GKR88_02195 [Flavobacteriaceae bacterium]